jgi:hypothetical protein
MTNIYEQKGDLLKSNDQYIIHQTNCMENF